MKIVCMTKYFGGDQITSDRIYLINISNKPY